MAKNVLVVGTGRFGRYTIETLHNLGHEILAVDLTEEKINKVLPFVASAEIGDSTDEEFLQTLGIGDFDLCVVAIGDNFMASLETASLLKDMGARKVVARATSELQERLLFRCGADDVVCPERQLGKWTAMRFSADNILDYIELADGYTIFEVEVPREWAGKRIVDLNIRRAYDANILGVSEGGKMNMSISAETVLGRGEKVLVLGPRDELLRLFKL